MRLDIERQVKLEPVRLAKAKEKITELGYEIVTETESMLTFRFNDDFVYYFVYSGWATGKTIKDGRGLKNLLNQIKQPSK